MLAQVQRADAQRVAAQYELLIAHIPQRQRPLTVHALKGPNAPGLPGMQNDLGVARCSKLVAQRLKLGAQFNMVEYFAVEDYPMVLLCIDHRLLSALQIDDRQAGMR